MLSSLLSNPTFCGITLAIASFLLYKFIIAPHSSSSSSPPSSSSSSSSSTSAASPYRGRELVDIVLQRRHGLRSDERRVWSLAEISKHNSTKDLWLIIDNKVYDVTDYVEDHAGGSEAISRNGGKDNSVGFHGPQHTSKVHDMIPEYYIGEVEGQGKGKEKEDDEKKKE